MITTPKVSLILGDCLEKIKDIPSNSIDLILIDPPYLTINESWDKKEVVNEELSSELFRILKPTGNLYVWCGIGEKSQSLIRWFPIFGAHFKFKDLITWKKVRGIGMRKGWLYTREEIMWFVKDNKQFIWNKEFQYTDEKRQFSGAEGNSFNSEFKRITNVWTDIKDNYMCHGNHPTSKPIAALERIIKCHTKEGDLVLDCFLGSGSTGVAAVNLKRDFIGIEKDEGYFRVATDRINEALTSKSQL